MRLIGMLYLGLLALSAVSATAVAQTNSLRLEVVSGSPQTLRLGQISEDRIVVRVVRTEDGQPVAGIPVDNFVNHSFCLPLDPNCNEFPEGYYGEFVDDQGQPAAYWTPITDAQGLAVLNRMRGGTVQSRYQVALKPSVPLGSPWGTTGFTMVDVIQSGRIELVAGARPIPATGAWTLSALVLLLVATATLGLRARLSGAA